MTRTGKNDTAREPAESAPKPKRYQFELGFKELVCYSFGLLLALTWMFIFGILVGRGIPLVGSEEISVRAHLMRFLGLGTQTAKEAEPEAVENFDSPRDMLGTLDYYLSLTRKKAETGPPPLRPLASPTSPAAKQPADIATEKQASQPPGQPLRSPEDSGKLTQQTVPAADTSPPEHLTEHFSLLVSSMKEAENAQRLLDQLRGKGYAPRIETVNLSGSGRWNRVLVGFFANRDEAMRFAAEFNRKERMEALVVRETR